MMDIGAAVASMKAGNKVAREGWNGKGMFLYLVPASNYRTMTAVAFEAFGETAPYQAYVAMKTAQNTVVPWLCSQSDLLATDWVIAP